MQHTQTLRPDLNPRFADPKNDAAFKKLFVDHLDLTKSFLNATLRLAGERRIKEITTLPIEQLPPTAESKKSILHVLCTDEGGSQYIIEVQNRYMHTYSKRIKHYISYAYIKQLGLEENYKNPKPVTLLNISDHKIFSDTIDYLSVYRDAEEKTNNGYLNDHTYVFIELPKFTKQEEELETAEDHWIYMIKSAELLHEIPSQAPEEVQKAYHILEKHTWTLEELFVHEKAHMALMDDIAVIDTALEKGRQIGLQEGLKEGKQAGLQGGLEKRD